MVNIVLEPTHPLYAAAYALGNMEMEIGRIKSDNVALSESNAELQAGYDKVFNLLTGLEAQVDVLRKELRMHKGERIIDFGMKFVGTPYQFGARTGATATFDCSSFVQHIYRQFGVEIPRTSIRQSRSGVAIADADLERGDLVFFDADPNRGTRGVVDHVGVYLGDNMVLHATPQNGVHVAQMWSKPLYLFGRRVL